MSRRSGRRPVQEYRNPDAPRRKRKAGAESKAGKGPHRYRWLFHAAPITGPGGRSVPFTVPEEYADDLARHIERCSMWSREALIEEAGPDGLLDPRDLPEASIRHDPPMSGPLGWLNPGPWVPADAPLPDREAPSPPDLTSLTDEEVAAIEAEKEAVDEALRRRRVWREKLRQADPEGRRGQ